MGGDDEEPEPALVSSRDGAVDGGPHGRWDPIGVAVLIAVALVALLLLGRAGGSNPDPRSTPDGPSTGPGARRIDPARAGDGPVFGQPVGLVIAVGGRGDDIHLIDLDTGDITSLGRTGTPRLIDGGRLIVEVAPDRWEVIDLATGGAEAITPEREGARYTSTVAAEAGGVWFRHAPGGDGRVWSRVAPASGDVLQEVTMPVGAGVPIDVDGSPLAGPEVVGSEAGRIFALGADGRYRLELDDRLIAVGRRLLLVSRCGSLTCDNRWIDRRSLDELDIPAPEPPLAGAFIRDDRRLFAETPGGSDLVVKVFDIATGHAIATGSPSGLDRSWVSPSGRFIAVPGFDALLITDIEAARTATIDHLRLDPDTQLAWGRI